jgi:hypothetical protein
MPIPPQAEIGVVTAPARNAGEGDLSYEVLAAGQFLSSLRLRFGPEFEVWVRRPTVIETINQHPCHAAWAQSGHELGTIWAQMQKASSMAGFRINLSC